MFSFGNQQTNKTEMCSVLCLGFVNCLFFKKVLLIQNVLCYFIVHYQTIWICIFKTVLKNLNNCPQLFSVDENLISKIQMPTVNNPISTLAHLHHSFNYVHSLSRSLFSCGILINYYIIIFLSKSLWLIEISNIFLIIFHIPSITNLFHMANNYSCITKSKL